MHTRLACILALAWATPAFASDTFTGNLSPQDFSAAGLSKLTPAELSALDALVHAREAGAVAVAKDTTAKEVAKTVRVQVQAEDQKAAQKQASSGIFSRMKVLLKPGTEIEYTSMDAAIRPPYDGYDPGTVLVLTNGQHWAVVDNSSDYHAAIHKPVPVHIIPGSMGSFFMEIEGSGRPRVKYVGREQVVTVPASP